MLPLLTFFPLSWIDLHHHSLGLCSSTDNLLDCRCLGYTKYNELRQCDENEKWRTVSNFVHQQLDTKEAVLIQNECSYQEKVKLDCFIPENY